MTWAILSPDCRALATRQQASGSIKGVDLALLQSLQNHYRSPFVSNKNFSPYEQRHFESSTRPYDVSIMNVIAAGLGAAFLYLHDQNGAGGVDLKKKERRRLEKAAEENKKYRRSEREWRKEQEAKRLAKEKEFRRREKMKEEERKRVQNAQVKSGRSNTRHTSKCHYAVDLLQLRRYLCICAHS